MSVASTMRPNPSARASPASVRSGRTTGSTSPGHGGGRALPGRAARWPPMVPGRGHASESDVPTVHSTAASSLRKGLDSHSSGPASQNQARQTGTSSARPAPTAWATAAPRASGGMAARSSHRAPGRSRRSVGASSEAIERHAAGQFETDSPAPSYDTGCCIPRSPGSSVPTCQTPSMGMRGSLTAPAPAAAPGSPRRRPRRRGRGARGAPRRRACPRRPSRRR